MSLIIQISEEEKILIKRFLQGSFRENPSFPKYNNIWDPSLVLSHIEKWFPLEKLNLDQLTQKLVTLLALTTAQRVQTWTKIALNDITILDDRVEIIIKEILKTSGPKKAQPIIVLPFFKDKPALCTASTLVHYLRVTEKFRKTSGNNNSLMLTCKKPVHPASTQIIARWIKNTLKQADIDTTKFSCHSTRHASTSAVFRAGIDIETIRKTAGWTTKSQVFNTFYNKPVLKHSAHVFMENVLKTN